MYMLLGMCLLCFVCKFVCNFMYVVLWARGLLLGAGPLLLSYITYNCISSHDCVPHAIQRCMTYSLYVLVSTPICMPTSQEYHHIKCMYIYIYTRINTICINNITLHHHDLYASCLGHLSKTFSPLLTGHQLKKKPP